MANFKFHCLSLNPLGKSPKIFILWNAISCLMSSWQYTVHYHAVYEYKCYGPTTNHKTVKLKFLCHTVDTYAPDIQ